MAYMGYHPDLLHKHSYSPRENLWNHMAPSKQQDLLLIRKVIIRSTPDGNPILTIGTEVNSTIRHTTALGVVNPHRQIVSINHRN